MLNVKEQYSRNMLKLTLQNREVTNYRHSSFVQFNFEIGGLRKTEHPTSVFRKLPIYAFCLCEFLSVRE